MDTIGDRLKKARNKKGISLKDAQKALKIHPNILKALEEDNAHQFLSSLYIRSFLRSYTRYLGLNADKIVEEYATERHEKPEQVLYIGERKEPVSSIATRYMPLAARIVAGVLVAIIALVIVINVTKFMKVRIGKVAQKIEIAKERESKPEESEKPSISIPRNRPLILVVKAKDEVWMEIESDGKKIFSGVLSKGKVETWEAKELIELRVGKAHELELILNGIQLGSPGKGVMKGIRITHKGMELP